MRRTNDFIKVTNMKVFAYHGVLEEEKKNGQDFYLYAKVYVDMRKAGLTDKLEDTINYDQICIFLAEVFAENVFETIEAAAEYTVQEIIVNFPTIEAMELEVRKPHAPLTYVPEDISLVGFDDNIYSKMCRPAITTIHQSPKRKSELAVDYMMRLLNGEEIENNWIRLPVELVIRDSVKKV